MFLDKPICLCGNTEFTVLFEGARKNAELKSFFRFSILKCKKCSLALTYPIPYTGNFKYDEPCNGSKLIENETIVNRDVFDLIAYENLKEIERYKKKGKILDVGCSACVLLNLARNRGWETKGVELSQAHCRYGKSIGLDVRNSTLKEANFPCKSFDVVSMIHVLEHIRDPIKELYEAERILKDNGIIVIDTPNIGSLIANIQRDQYLPLEPDCHIWQFTPTTLMNLIIKAGFTPQSVVIHSRNFRYLKLLCKLNGTLRQVLSVAGLLFKWGICGDSVRIIAHKNINAKSNQEVIYK